MDQAWQEGRGSGSVRQVELEMAKTGEMRSSERHLKGSCHLGVVGTAVAFEWMGSSRQLAGREQARGQGRSRAALGGWEAREAAQEGEERQPQGQGVFCRKQCRGC